MIVHVLHDTEVVRLLGGFSFLVILAVIGYYITSLHQSASQPCHYSNYEHVKAFQGTIVSDYSERKDYFRYELELTSVLQDSVASLAQGTIFLYVRKGEMDTVYRYGDQLSVLAGYFPVNAPGNPEEFDYRAYLQKQGIYAHAFASTSDIEILANAPPSWLMNLSIAIRVKVKAIIQEVIWKEREQSILLALLVGIKDHIDNETKAAYSSAGAMHVLAVSGLHVGIIFLFINVLLGFLKKNKWGKVLFVFLSLSLIWAYALVTGFSPSVLRASVMFSVILISQTVGKQSNIYNSLGLAAFVLLLYDPYLIYSVGFQLSFAAVFGIVFLQPRLVRLFSPSTKFAKYFWEITCVSIAAQLATFPLTVFYFHQFPTYFLVSNLIVIPAAMGILLGGIVAIFLALINATVGFWFGCLVFGLIWVVNELVALLMLLPLPIVDWLYFDFYDTLFVYAIILALSLALEYYSRFSVYVGLVCSIAWCLYLTFSFHENASQKRIIFYEIKDKIAIDLVDGNRALLLIDKLDTAEMEVVSFQINPFRLANGLPPVHHSYVLLDSADMVRPFDFGYLLSWRGNRIMILNNDKDLVWDEQLPADIVYLENERVVSFGQMEVKSLIFGANLNAYKVKGMQDKASEASLKSHSLAEQGYFEIRW